MDAPPAYRCHDGSITGSLDASRAPEKLPPGAVVTLTRCDGSIITMDSDVRPVARRSNCLHLIAEDTEGDVLIAQEGPDGRPDLATAVRTLDVRAARRELARRSAARVEVRHVRPLALTGSRHDVRQTRGGGRRGRRPAGRTASRGGDSGDEGPGEPPPGRGGAPRHVSFALAAFLAELGS